jgi:hypothetical protein
MISLVLIQSLRQNGDFSFSSLLTLNSSMPPFLSPLPTARAGIWQDAVRAGKGTMEQEHRAPQLALTTTSWAGGSFRHSTRMGNTIIWNPANCSRRWRVKAV